MGARAAPGGGPGLGWRRRPHRSALEGVRTDFPILAREVEGRPIAYLDNAATAQKPTAVIEAVDSYYRNSNANVHRSMHVLAAEAEELYEGGRRKVAELVGARPGEIVFVRNATEAINLVRFTWARENVGPGDVVLITAMEHHSNVVPWQLLCQERGARLEYVEIDAQGKLDLSDFDERLARGVKLVALTHVSNVLGTINPVAEVAERAHAAGAAVLVDGAQAVPQFPVDVTATGADFYAFTGHKMYGPTGIGVLWGRRELLDEMPPFLGGGSMIKPVEDDHSTWAAVPAKFEAGTPAIAESAGLGAAADFMTGLGMEAVRAHERELTAYALERVVRGAGRDRLRARRRCRARRARELHGRGHPPARPRGAVQPRGRGDPRRPPLRAAADAAARRPGHRPRFVRRLQHDRRGRPPGRRARNREVDLRGLRWILSTASTSSTTTRTRGTSAICPQPDAEFEDRNPLCGDEMGVQIKLEGDRIADLRFHGQGCAISQATASIISDELKGKTVAEVAGLDRQVHRRGDRHRALPHPPQVRPAVVEGGPGRPAGYG